jgi:hypothetical protein
MLSKNPIKSFVPSNWQDIQNILDTVLKLIALLALLGVL